MKSKTKMIIKITLLMITLLFSIAEVQAKNLSKKEKSYYRNILANKIYRQHSGIYDQAMFTFYDANGDGRKEMFVYGPLGLRSMSYTVVYSYDGKKFTHAVVSGDLVKVSNKGFYCECNDYSLKNDGEMIFLDNTCYTLTKKGIVTKRYEESKSELLRSDGLTKVLSHTYKNGSEKPISKNTYKKGIKKYKLKKVDKKKVYEVNADNIAKCLK